MMMSRKEHTQRAPEKGAPDVALAGSDKSKNSTLFIERLFFGWIFAWSDRMLTIAGWLKGVPRRRS
jgi:hypothetical protein